MNINELIEQIGGRERLEQIKKHASSDANETVGMARALLAVLDAKPIGITDNAEVECLLRGEMANVMPPNYRGVDKGDEVYIYTTPTATSVPDRNQLRELVDMVWNEATESETVPSTADTDRIIDKVFHGIAQEPASSRYQSATPAPGGE